MRSYARSTLTLLAIVAAAAIVGVAHAAEGRTATAAAARPTDTPRTATTTVAALRPTDEVMEAGRWFGLKKHSYSSWKRPIYKRPYSSTKNTYTTAVGVTKTCVSPIIAIDGTSVRQARSPRPATFRAPAQFSRWLNKYAHGTSHKNTHTQKSICCDGYVCKQATDVTAKVVGTPSGSTTPE
jgi:hypothetical protein